MYVGRFLISLTSNKIWQDSKTSTDFKGSGKFRPYGPSPAQTLSTLQVRRRVHQTGLVTRPHLVRKSTAPPQSSHEKGWHRAGRKASEAAATLCIIFDCGTRSYCAGARRPLPKRWGNMFLDYLHGISGAALLPRLLIYTMLLYLSPCRPYVVRMLGRGMLDSAVLSRSMTTVVPTLRLREEVDNRNRRKLSSSHHAITPSSLGAEIGGGAAK